ncbi:MAG: hypothetical protein HY721_24025, partial [Planctomycetes bacterium]|nr:hypothetical protein [Planctomycetota bacterium]
MSFAAVLAALLVALPAGRAARGQEGAPRGPGVGGVVVLQAEVERRYVRLQALMAKLLDAIEKTEEKGRVATAMRRSEDLKIVVRLRGIQDLLKSAKLRDALEEEKAAEKDLERVLRILQGRDEAEEAKEDKEKLKELKDALERLEKLAAEEE